MGNNLGNKQTMAENIRYYMDKSSKTRAEMAKITGVAYATFSDWVNARSYPRIDKIEIMANYWHIAKSDLVEKRNSSITCSVPESVYELMTQLAIDPRAVLLNLCQHVPDDKTAQAAAFLFELVHSEPKYDKVKSWRGEGK